MKIGPYRLWAGKYWVTRDFWLFEIHVKGPWVYLDIDWTDNAEFPVGWCGALNLGPGEPSRWRVHWSWNAPHDEPNRLNLSLRRIQVDLSCLTWWKETFTDSGEPGSGGCCVIHVGRERCRPYLEDGWPMIRVRRSSGAA